MVSYTYCNLHNYILAMWFYSIVPPVVRMWLLTARAPTNTGPITSTGSITTVWCTHIHTYTLTGCVLLSYVISNSLALHHTHVIVHTCLYTVYNVYTVYCIQRTRCTLYSVQCTVYIR